MKTIRRLLNLLRRRECALYVFHRRDGSRVYIGAANLTRAIEYSRAHVAASDILYISERYEHLES